MSLKTIIAGLIAGIASIFHKVESIADIVLSTTDNIINELKVLQSNNTVQFLETTLISLLPAPLAAAADALKLWLPSALAKIANLSDTITTDEAKINGGLDYLQKLQADPALYAGVLTTLNADAQQLLKQFADNPEAITLTPQMSLVAAVVQHDPTLATV